MMRVLTMRALMIAALLFLATAFQQGLAYAQTPADTGNQGTGTNYNTNANPYYASGYYGECTWYVWGRCKDAGWSLHSSTGKLPGADTEYNDIDGCGGKDPLVVQVNAIECCYYPSSNHVCYVYHVDSQTQWEIAQYNVTYHTYTTETVTRSSPNSTALHCSVSGNVTLVGFIYGPVPHPTGSITNPSQDGTVVRGPITITGTAVDPSPVTSIKLSLDGTAFATVNPPASPWSVPFNLVGVHGGLHIITVTITDQAGVSISYGRIIRRPAVIGDYDGDGRVDYGVFRPNSGWFGVVCSNGTGPSQGFGNSGDIPVPGDYDGDGRTDYAVYRPSTGQWFVDGSSGAQMSHPLGNAGDIPVPADYFGDGVTDYAVFRPSTGQWLVYNPQTYAQMSGNNGQPGDIPVPGDYDGDGKADFAVYRPSTGQWFVNGSSGAQKTLTLGNPGDIPVPADYFGDGVTDYAVFRPTTGQWLVYNPITTAQKAGNNGQPGDIPVPGDYDGDGKADFAVFRPSSGWFGVVCSNGTTPSVGFGQLGDIPISYFLAGIGL